jgi:hypothetical protein
MKRVLNNKEPKPQEFIVLNEYCQVFCGLRRGYPAFSDNMDDAKPIWNEQQFKNIKYGTNFILEKHFI